MKVSNFKYLFYDLIVKENNIWTQEIIMLSIRCESLKFVPYSLLKF